jgi:hypothetical protein
VTHQKNNRADKFRIDDMTKDKEGIAPRLNELIKLARWCFYILIAIGSMVSLFFLRDAWSVVVSLFK